MKDVQCYELFGGIALKNHAFSFFVWEYSHQYNVIELVKQKLNDYYNHCTCDIISVSSSWSPLEC